MSSDDIESILLNVAIVEDIDVILLSNQLNVNGGTPPFPFKVALIFPSPPFAQVTFSLTIVDEKFIEGSSVTVKVNVPLD